MNYFKYIFIYILIMIISINCASSPETVQLQNSDSDIFLNKTGSHENYFISLIGEEGNNEEDHYSLKITDIINDQVIIPQKLNVKILKKNTSYNNSSKLSERDQLVLDIDIDLIKEKDTLPNIFTLDKLGAGSYNFILAMEIDDNPIEMKFIRNISSQYVSSGRSNPSHKRR